MQAIKKLFGFLAVSLAVVLPLSAYALDVQTSGDITYITGGIGDEERTQLDASKKDFNLEIFNAYKTGEYVGTAHIVIKDKKGAEVLTVDAGPIFMVKLPPGTYALEVTADDKTEAQKSKATVTASGHKEIGLYW